MQGTLTWTFAYDVTGNRTTHSNGATITYTHLNNNWPGTITHKRSGGAIFDTITHACEANANRLTATASRRPYGI